MSLELWNKGWDNIKPKPLTERFWLKVDKKGDNECWLWKGKITRYGYGVLNNNYKTIPAHRISYIIHNGAIPDGLFVLHQCDVPNCVNPKHLFLGTQSDNIKDMFKKKRNRNQYSYDKDFRNGKSIYVEALIESEWIKFDTITIAAKETKTHISGISKVINGTAKTSGGLIWRRATI